jgi:hypothetical protein
MCETAHGSLSTADTVVPSVANIHQVESARHTTVNMEPTEIQARAAIAAALIMSRAVEVPSIPASGEWSEDAAALRLQDLADYVYKMIYEL